MKLHRESHVDHVSQDVVTFVLDKFKHKTGSFTETFDLPEHLPPLQCKLYGPVMGDVPVPEAECVYETRYGRPWPSRLVVRHTRETRQCTVIAGPYQGMDCVLYTVHGGPKAPKELNDPSLKPEERAASEEFWSEHALAR